MGAIPLSERFRWHEGAIFSDYPLTQLLLPYRVRSCSAAPRGVRLSHRFHLFWISTVALFLGALCPPAFGAGFSPQIRVGLRAGDQWEPAIAADGYGHVYVLYPQYGLVAGCPDCPLPSMTLQISDDNGAHWQRPHEITAHLTGQFDPQIVVDPADQRTV